MFDPPADAVISHIEYVSPGIPIAQLLWICTPLAVIEIEKSVEPLRSGILEDSIIQKVVQLKRGSRRKPLLEAEAEKPWITFERGDLHERAEVVFRIYSGGIEKFSYGGNVAFETTQEDGIYDSRIWENLLVMQPRHDELVAKIHLPSSSSAW
jgi:hypothetical protein